VDLVAARPEEFQSAMDAEAMLVALEGRRLLTLVHRGRRSRERDPG
jgi:hypothetical protein